MELDLTALKAGVGPIGELPATSLPIIAGVLGAFFELDNSGKEEKDDEKKSEDKSANGASSKKRIAKDEEAEEEQEQDEEQEEYATTPIPTLNEFSRVSGDNSDASIYGKKKKKQANSFSRVSGDNADASIYGKQSDSIVESRYVTDNGQLDSSLDKSVSQSYTYLGASQKSQTKYSTPGTIAYVKGQQYTMDIPVQEQSMFMDREEVQDLFANSFSDLSRQVKLDESVIVKEKNPNYQPKKAVVGLIFTAPNTAFKDFCFKIEPSNDMMKPFYNKKNFLEAKRHRRGLDESGAVFCAEFADILQDAKAADEPAVIRDELNKMLETDGQKTDAFEKTLTKSVDAACTKGGKLNKICLELMN